LTIDAWASSCLGILHSELPEGYVGTTQQSRRGCGWLAGADKGLEEPAVSKASGWDHDVRRPAAERLAPEAMEWLSLAFKLRTVTAEGC
jgi:hypothetical protein